MSGNRTLRTPPNLPTKSRLTALDFLSVTDPTLGVQQIDPYTLSLGTQLAAISQLAGFTAANIVEVEAASKALRVTVRALTKGGEVDAFGFTVSHHSWGRINSITSTTAAFGQQAYWTCGWAGSGYACINKIMVSSQLGAVVGARSGSSRIDLAPQTPQSDLLAARTILANTGNSLWLPTIDGATGALSMKSMNVLNPEPQLQIMGAVSLAQGSVFGGGNALPVSTSALMAQILGIAGGTAGVQEIPPTLIFDARLNQGYEPLLLWKQKGLMLYYTGPAAVTSQTVNLGVTMQWDEWVPDTGE